MTEYRRLDTITRTLKYWMWFTEYCHMKDADFKQAEKFRTDGFSYDFETTLFDEIRVLPTEQPSIGVLKHWVTALEADQTDQLDRIELELAEIKQLLLAPKPRKPSKPREAKRYEYDSKFKAIWKGYPKHNGSKVAAYAQYQARLAETEKPLALSCSIHIAVYNYAKFIEVTDQWVMAPERFMGAKKYYENDWTLPKVKPAADPDKQHIADYVHGAPVEVPPGADRDLT